MNLFIKKTLLLILLCVNFNYEPLRAQPIPTAEENIEYLVTFGAESDTSWGDDDFCQTFFFLVPEDYPGNLNIRVFDPETSGKLDENKGRFNTSVKFSLYGGIGAWSHSDAQQSHPSGEYDSGNHIASKVFSANKEYDEKWYSFGPFSATEGEYVEKFRGYVFKLIVEGVKGDDGNLYKLFMSSDRTSNVPIEGGNVFTYEYSFRLSNDVKSVAHLYPYLDDKVTSVRIINYDWDNDGFIRAVSVSKRGELCRTSSDDNWVESELPISEAERGSSLDIQLIKDRKKKIENNNVVVVILNQYGNSIPFFASPIGGIPVYNPSLKMKAVK